MSAPWVVELAKKATESFGFSITGGHPSPTIVSQVKPGSPAAQSGVAVGDQILEMNDSKLVGLTQFKVVAKVKQAKTSLKLLLCKPTADVSGAVNVAPGTPERSRRAADQMRQRARNEVGPAKSAPVAVSVVSAPAAAPVATPAPAAAVVAPAPTPAASAASTGETPGTPPCLAGSPTANTGLESNPALAAVLSRIEAAAQQLGIALTKPGAGAADRLAAIVTALEGQSVYEMLALMGVVRRLELVATALGAPSSGSAPAPAAGGSDSQRLASVVATLEAASQRISGGGPNPAALVPEGADPPSVVAFDKILATDLRQFVMLSVDMADDVAQISTMVQNAFICQRRFLNIVPQSTKPGPKVLPDLLEATTLELQGIQEIRERSRASPSFNHLSTVSEGIAALGWVTVEPKPAPFVADMVAASEFYANRVVKEFKEKDQKHVDWARAFIALLKSVQAYVKEHHTTGLVWGKKTRSMTFWLNAISQTSPGAGDADEWVYSTKYGMPVRK